MIESSEYALLFITFLGAPYLLEKNRHVVLDLMVNNLRGRRKKISRLVNALVGLVVCAFLTIVGVHVVLDQFSIGVREVTVMSPQSWWITAADADRNGPDGRPVPRCGYPGIRPRGAVTMEWYVTLIVILVPLFILMGMGLPVAFAFFTVNLFGAYILMGGTAGIEQLILNTVDSISSFTLIPIALFMIMGEAMFQSRIAIDLMDTLDKWFGKLRGRLALMAVGGGVLFSTLTGNSMGSIALLGSSLTPEMEKRGYKKPMSLGPILGSSGLAIMIPPSSLAVVLGVIAEISIGRS